MMTTKIDQLPSTKCCSSCVCAAMSVGGGGGDGGGADTRTDGEPLGRCDVVQRYTFCARAVARNSCAESNSTGECPLDAPCRRTKEVCRNICRVGAAAPRSVTTALAGTAAVASFLCSLAHSSCVLPRQGGDGGSVGIRSRCTYFIRGTPRGVDIIGWLSSLRD